MCLKRRPKNEERRPKTLWSKRKTLWSKTKTQQSKTFFPSGKDGKTVSATNLKVTLSQSVQRVSKVRNAVKFQQYRNIIFHDDLVYVFVTNILFLKCISENYDEVTLLLRYILSVSYDIFMYALQRCVKSFPLHVVNKFPSHTQLTFAL